MGLREFREDYSAPAMFAGDLGNCLDRLLSDPFILVYLYHFATYLSFYM